MFSKRSVIYLFVILALILGLGACQPPDTPSSAPPPDTPKPEEQTSTSTPISSESEGRTTPNKWWRDQRVWIQTLIREEAPDDQIIIPDVYSQVGARVCGFYGREETQVEGLIDFLHQNGILVAGGQGLITSYDPYWSPASGFMPDEPSELADALVQDPFGNYINAASLYGLDQVGDDPWWGDSFFAHSTLHPNWQNHMLQHMKNMIDHGVDGLFTDELAYGSIWLPDFNPHTVEQFRQYLLDTYSHEELMELGAPWGIEDFNNFDYAVLLREYIPEDMVPLTNESWGNWEFQDQLPLIDQYRRFVRLEHQRFVAWLIKEGRDYAKNIAGKEIPFASNLNDLSNPDAFHLLPELDYVILEYPYMHRGYFPNARAGAPLKFARFFDIPGTTLPDMNSYGVLLDMKKEETVNFYRTIIADTTAGGGSVYLNHLAFDAVDQDMDALTPYYRFVIDHPILFEGVEAAKGQVGVLHLWESLTYSDWDPNPYFIVTNLLSDSGYHFDTIFAAEEFTIGGELPFEPAPNIPLELDTLIQYPVLIIPELNFLTENHADVLLQYIEQGGALVVFSTPENTWRLDENNPFIAQILSSRGRGVIEISSGLLVHKDVIWPRDYNAVPPPQVHEELQRVLESVDATPDIHMLETRYLGATAYQGSEKLVVHFVNYEHDFESDITTPTGPVDVEIALPDGFQVKDPGLYLFTPGEMHQSIEGVLDGNLLRLTLPDVYIWSVLLIGEEGLIGEQVAALPTFTPTPLPPTTVPTSTPTPTPTPLPDLSAEAIDAGYIVYDDDLSRGWSLDPWGGTADQASLASIYQGSNSIEVTLNPGGGLTFDRGSFDASEFDFMVLHLNGDSTIDQQLYVEMKSGDNTPLGERVYLTGSFIVDGPLQPDQWHQVMVPLSTLNPDRKTFAWFDIGDASGAGASTFYLDEIRFVTAAE